MLFTNETRDSIGLIIVRTLWLSGRALERETRLSIPYEDSELFCFVLFFLFVPRSKQHELKSSSTTFQIYFINLLSVLTLWIIVARCAFRLVTCSLSASSSSLRSFCYAPLVREQLTILNLLTQFQNEA